MIRQNFIQLHHLTIALYVDRAHLGFREEDARERKLLFRLFPDMVAITLKRKFHMARVMQRTLNERASEKYQRLQSSETGGFYMARDKGSTNG